jgi:hypothetical protein
LTAASRAPTNPRAAPPPPASAAGRTWCAELAAAATDAGCMGRSPCQPHNHHSKSARTLCLQRPSPSARRSFTLPPSSLAPTPPWPGITCPGDCHLFWCKLSYCNPSRCNPSWRNLQELLYCMERMEDSKPLAHYHVPPVGPTAPTACRPFAPPLLLLGRVEATTARPAPRAWPLPAASPFGRAVAARGYS